MSSSRAQGFPVSGIRSIHRAVSYPKYPTAPEMNGGRFSPGVVHGDFAWLDGLKVFFLTCERIVEL